MSTGKCPDCGRAVRLGKLVRERYVVGPDGFLNKETIATEERVKCRDCRLGPPKHLWKTCPECGAQTPILSSCQVCRAKRHLHGEVELPKTSLPTLTFYDGLRLWLQPGAQESSRECPDMDQQGRKENRCHGNAKTIRATATENAGTAAHGAYREISNPP